MIIQYIKQKVNASRKKTLDKLHNCPNLVRSINKHHEIVLEGLALLGGCELDKFEEAIQGSLDSNTAYKARIDFDTNHTKKLIARLMQGAEMEYHKLLRIHRLCCKLGCCPHCGDEPIAEEDTPEEPEPSNELVAIVSDPMAATMEEYP